jgi:dephospho-CoA kinase
MSGTGKSAVVGALIDRGFKAIDTDYGWCEQARNGEWIWSEPKIQELLSTEDTEVLFVAGCASNQAKFYDQLDLVLLLSAPASLMVERIKSRSGNPFGKSPEQLAQVLGDLESVEPLLRKGADAEVSTDRPLNEVVEEILTLCCSLE